MNTHNTPILIVSMPRSGSSLLSHILFNEGVQVGDCKKGDEYNKYGYYENIMIRNILIKYLNKHDVNNLKNIELLKEADSACSEWAIGIITPKRYEISDFNDLLLGENEEPPF